jgi:uncharacterized protein (DUF2141 family)
MRREGLCRGEGLAMKAGTIRWAIALLLLLPSLGGDSPAQPAVEGHVIRIAMTGFRNDKGQALCALFTPGKAFPTDTSRAAAHVSVPVSQGRAVCEFADVAPGRYAVSVVHDENSNQKMDTNFLGIRKEGVGASNDAKGKMGPPKFDAAAFTYSGGRLELTIKIVYI